MGARQAILKLANKEWYEWTEGEEILKNFMDLDSYVFEPLHGIALKVNDLGYDKYGRSSFATVEMRFKLELQKRSRETEYLLQIKPLTFESEITFAFDEDQHQAPYRHIHNLIKKELGRE